MYPGGWESSAVQGTVKRRGWTLTIAGFLLGLPSPARADWMLGGFLGHAWTRPSTVILILPGQQTQLELVDLHYRGESFESPPYYGLRISWIKRAQPWMAIEGEFVHAKVFAETDRLERVRGILGGAPIDAPFPLSALVQRLAMSHGLNFILGNFVVRRHVGSADSSGRHNVVAVLRVGAGWTLPHAESTIGGIGSEQYESGGPGAQVGGGLEMSVWRGVYVVGEYKFTLTTPQVDVAGGEAKIPARSHHLLSGLGYRF
jgi:hypothetical protein